MISAIAGIIFLIQIMTANFTAMSLQTDSVTDEIEKIKETAMLYVNGVKYADTERIDKAFHKDWNMTGFYEEGDYRHFDRDQFMELIERNRQNATHFPRYEGGVVNIEHTGKTAVAKIRLENERVIFTDYISLLKVDGQWKIIHKIWDTELK